MKKDLLVIIPAYNEEESIGLFLDQLLEHQITDIADIIVINDSSSDNTRQIVISKNIVCLNHPYNLGYGTALQTGYKYAVSQNYKYVIQIDSDGQHDVSNIRVIYDKLCSRDKLNHVPDLVIGSRFLQNSISFKIPFAKKIAIAFFQKIIYLTSKNKITDPTSGLQGLNYSVFEYYSHFGNFDNNYPDSNMIVQMALLGYKIEEVPAIMHPRKSGQSMHFGLIEPIQYMGIMIFSTINVFLRKKMNLLSKPYHLKDEHNSEKN